MTQKYYDYGRYSGVARELQSALDKDGVGYVTMLAGKNYVRIQLSKDNNTFPSVNIVMSHSQWENLISRLTAVAFVRELWYNKEPKTIRLVG